uniref:Ribosome recycling factor n=1 Tax=Griffithsia japonica TaxID=83288 RepID=Q7XY97_GRIJA|nr:ribosome recycling factor [Griffithsia japonica]
MTTFIPSSCWHLNGGDSTSALDWVKTVKSRRSILICHPLPVVCELTENDTAEKSEARMQKTIDSVKSAFNSVRTGRASPSLLDRIQVNYYGADTPLNSLATVSVSGTSTLVVEPYDKSCISDIERSLMESDIGLTPNSDGSTIRLSIPQLTKERRSQLVKQVKSMAEDGRVAIRNIRRDAVDSIKKLEKKSELGKDESKTLQDRVQKLTDKYVKTIESVYKQKEEDIMKV